MIDGRELGRDARQAQTRAKASRPKFTTRAGAVEAVWSQYVPYSRQNGEELTKRCRTYEESSHIRMSRAWCDSLGGKLRGEKIDGCSNAVRRQFGRHPHPTTYKYISLPLCLEVSGGVLFLSLLPSFFHEDFPSLPRSMGILPHLLHLPVAVSTSGGLRPSGPP
jgi:hypothetical protein